ncbi:alpha/beta hydrolase, partial [Thioclava sp. BHET1]
MNMAVHLNRVTFTNGSIEVAAHLRLPDGLDFEGSFPAIVVVGPGSSVKEQAGGIYAEKLAARGYVTLVFDPSYQGESGGEPRDLESPAVRVEDIRCAIDFLMMLPYVDENAIGILGICAGGGYAVNAATTDHRIKAVGMVVGTDLGTAFRRMQPQAAAVTCILAAAAAQRTAEARGGDAERMPWLPDSIEAAKAAGIDDPSVLEAIDFYCTPRGQHPNRTNLLLARSLALILGFDAFNLADQLLIQPTQIIVGGKLGTTFSHEAG